MANLVKSEIKEKIFKQLSEDPMMTSYQLATMFQIPVSKATYYKNKFYETQLDEEKKKEVSAKVLNNLNRTTEEFEELFNYTKNLLLQAENALKPTSKGFNTKLAILREIREQLTIALKKLGELKNTTSNVVAINVYNQIIPEVAEELYSDLFKRTGKIESRGEKIVLENPPAEFIDAYLRYLKETNKIVELDRFVESYDSDK